MTTKRSKLEKLKKVFAVSAFAGLSILFVQKIYASETKPVQSQMQEMTTSTSPKVDTIPKKKSVQRNVKIRDNKKVPTPPTPRVMKENEYPIPPPPPPASNITEAQFPEGINALRMNFSQNFDSSEFGKSEKVVLKTQLYIKIDENGKTTDVRADGPNEKFNAEAVRTMKIATENVLWKPATEEEKPVPTVFQLPITMSF